MSALRLVTTPSKGAVMRANAFIASSRSSSACADFTLRSWQRNPPVSPPRPGGYRIQRQQIVPACAVGLGQFRRSVNRAEVGPRLRDLLVPAPACRWWPAARPASHGHRCPVPGLHIAGNAGIDPGVVSKPCKRSPANVTRWPSPRAGEFDQSDGGNVLVPRPALPGNRPRSAACRSQPPGSAARRRRRASPARLRPRRHSLVSFGWDIEFPKDRLRLCRPRTIREEGWKRRTKWRR